MGIKLSIEEYLAERETLPDGLVEIGYSSNGFEWLFSSEEILNKFGISSNVVAGAHDADNKCISKLCIRILKLILERQKLEKAGETATVSRGKAIGDNLINYFIVMMLEAVVWNGYSMIPRDLIFFIREQLSRDDTQQMQRVRAIEGRDNAVFIAAQMLVKGEIPSYRAIASFLDVNPTTVNRWFSKNSLEVEARELLKLPSMREIIVELLEDNNDLDDGKSK